MLTEQDVPNICCRDFLNISWSYLVKSGAKSAWIVEQCNLKSFVVHILNCPCEVNLKHLLPLSCCFLLALQLRGNPLLRSFVYIERYAIPQHFNKVVSSFHVRLWPRLERLMPPPSWWGIGPSPCEGQSGWPQFGRWWRSVQLSTVWPAVLRSRLWSMFSCCGQEFLALLSRPSSHAAQRFFFLSFFLFSSPPWCSLWLDYPTGERGEKVDQTWVRPVVGQKKVETEVNIRSLLSSDCQVLHTVPSCQRLRSRHCSSHSGKDHQNPNSHLSGPARRQTVQMWLTESWACRSLHGPPHPRCFHQYFGYQRSNLAIIKMRTGHVTRTGLHQGVGFLQACKKNPRMLFKSSALVFLSWRVPNPRLAAHGEAFWL